ncbi:hypothetical protein Sjap_004173 [Stephania japonica]|uniref:Survival Motor Neuron Gemin2-binding domain-containing protein n=1 Tax=Stephania japonica TaxID=461633 RepID=A0AAP0K411_9MAGN
MSNLWDDSVLINAFNQAVSSYNVMHGNGSSENEKTVANDATSVPTVDDEIRKEKRLVEEFDSGSFEFISSNDVEEANNLPSFEGNHQTYLDNSVPKMPTENVPNPQEARGVPESSEGADEYSSQMNQLVKQYNELGLEAVDKFNQLNQLAKQYNELEAQRQNLSEQLRQVGYWDSSSPGADYSSYTQPDTHYYNSEYAERGACPSNRQYGLWGTYPSNTQYAEWGNYPSSTQYAQWGTYPSYSQYDEWSTYPSNRQCAQCGTFASSSKGYQVPKHQTYNPAGCRPFPQPNDPTAVYPPTPPLYKPVETEAYRQDVGHCSPAPCPVKVGCSCCAYCNCNMSKDPNVVQSLKGTGRMSPEDEQHLRTLIRAAKKPLSSMTRKDPGPSNLNEDTTMGEKVLSGLLVGELTESINSQPDLKVVLDAWYSAGFYTSKYLSKQLSMQKDGTDGSSA